MSNQVKAGRVNAVLLLIVGLLAGFVGGYAISHRGVASVTALETATPGGNCPYELAAADRDIIDGFKCPAVTCSDLLQDCHCETAHQIKQMVKQLLSEGKSPEQVRSEIHAMYNLKM